MRDLNINLAWPQSNLTNLPQPTRGGLTRELRLLKGYHANRTTNGISDTNRRDTNHRRSNRRRSPIHSYPGTTTEGGGTTTAQRNRIKTRSSKHTPGTKGPLGRTDAAVAP